MNLFKRTYWIIFPFILFSCLLILDTVFNIDNFLIRTLISGSIAYVLSPRKKIVKTQIGQNIQITWIFFKNPIIIDK